jgi:5'-3' exonuclease
MLHHRILLIDNSPVMHVLKHSTDFKRLKKNEVNSYIIINYLFRLQFLIKKVKPTVCVFALDAGESKRKEIFPAYKEKRKKTKKKPEQIELDKIAYPQFNEIENKVLPTLGFKNIFKTNGFEADDIIARICKDNKSSDIFIVSNDEDLYQLLTNTVCIINARTNKFFTKQDFIKKYRIQPNDWKKAKSLAGCISDEVPGIPGVGIPTVINYLNNELPTHYKTYQKIKNPKYYDLIMRNKRLVVLPFEGTPEYEIDFENKPTKKGIQKVAERYNFLPMKKDFKFWYKILRGM